MYWARPLMQEQWENVIKKETGKRTSLSASSPRCRDESERTVCLCHENAKSSWWLWPYHFQCVQREDTPHELCISLAFWKGSVLKAEGSSEYGWLSKTVAIDVQLWEFLSKQPIMWKWRNKTRASLKGISD